MQQTKVLLTNLYRDFEGNTKLYIGYVDNLRTDNDVVDGNVDEFDEVTDETHDGESDGGCYGDLLKLFPVWLGAPVKCINNSIDYFNRNCF